MNNPIRPVFENGQRLTAERLTQAFDFVRDMVRRVLLAPLSSGVAEGFGFSPQGADSASTLTVSPGLAIDGLGRLIVMPEPVSFSLEEIAAAAGVVPATNVIVRVCIALDDHGTAPDACSVVNAAGVQEGYQFIFQEDTVSAALFEAVTSFIEPNSVPAYGDLDPPYLEAKDRCVTLGHVVFTSAGLFRTTLFLRDGVSPRFKAIRNTTGTPSILLNETDVSPGFGLPERIPLVAFPVVTLFGPQPMLATGPAYFSNLQGTSVQATHVAAYGTNIVAGRVSPGSAQVFEASGGSHTIPSGLAGVSAVPIEFGTVNGSVSQPGEPLIMITASAGGAVAAKRLPPGVVYPVETLIGLSATGSYTLASDPTKTAVGVATGGLVAVRVDSSGGALLQGTELTAPALGSDALVAVGTPGTGRVLARLAQSVPISVSPTAAFAWVVT